MTTPIPKPKKKIMTEFVISEISAVPRGHRKVPALS